MGNLNTDLLKVVDPHVSKFDFFSHVELSSFVFGFIGI